MLFAAVARPSSDGVVIHYLLPVLWMTSHFHKTSIVRRGVLFLSDESVTAETTAHRSNQSLLDNNDLQVAHRGRSVLPTMPCRSC